MVASREGLHQRERILQLLHYNDAILYTWFNAEVFNGKEKFLTYEDQFSFRFKENKWRLIFKLP